MTKEEFLKLASEKWDTLQDHKLASDDLYDYEKGFDKLWVEFGKVSLEGSIGELSQDRRKKNHI